MEEETPPKKRRPRGRPSGSNSAYYRKPGQSRAPRAYQSKGRTSAVVSHRKLAHAHDSSSTSSSGRKILWIAIWNKIWLFPKPVILLYIFLPSNGSFKFDAIDFHLQVQIRTRPGFGGGSLAVWRRHVCSVCPWTLSETNLLNRSCEIGRESEPVWPMWTPWQLTERYVCTFVCMYIRIYSIHVRTS